MIDNPEYEAQADVYKLPPLKFVGFELWQARARSRLSSGAVHTHRHFQSLACSSFDGHRPAHVMPARSRHGPQTGARRRAQASCKAPSTQAWCPGSDAPPVRAQVKSGSIFDNVLVTDDARYAEDFAAATWGKSKDAETTMFGAITVKKAEAAEAEAKRKAVRFQKGMRLG